MGGVGIKGISVMISHPKLTDGPGKSTNEVHKSGCGLPTHVPSLRVLVYDGLNGVGEIHSIHVGHRLNTAISIIHL